MKCGKEKKKAEGGGRGNRSNGTGGANQEV